MFSGLAGCEGGAGAGGVQADGGDGVGVADLGLEASEWWMEWRDSDLVVLSASVAIMDFPR